MPSFSGIPFNDTNWRLQIAERGQAILGDNLAGLQAGSEPDLYVASVFALYYAITNAYIFASHF